MIIYHHITLTQMARKPEGYVPSIKHCILVSYLNGMICLGFQNAISYIDYRITKEKYNIQTNPFIHFFTVNFGFEQKIPFLGTNITYLYRSPVKGNLESMMIFPFPVWWDRRIRSRVPPVETPPFSASRNNTATKASVVSGRAPMEPKTQQAWVCGCRIFVTKKYWEFWD